MLSFEEAMNQFIPKVSWDTTMELAAMFNINPNYIMLNWMEYFLFCVHQIAPQELPVFISDYFDYQQNRTDEKLEKLRESKQALIDIIDLVMATRVERKN